MNRCAQMVRTVEKTNPVGVARRGRVPDYTPATKKSIRHSMEKMQKNLPKSTVEPVRRSPIATRHG